MMFLDGTDKRLFGSLVKSLADNYALDDETKYPDDVEEALEILRMYGANDKKRKFKEKPSGERQASFVMKCWHCKKEGHKKTDCPKLAANAAGPVSSEDEEGSVSSRNSA
eukprot:scaffold8527_cov226-Cylindrotheca_fusiformis.AAC.1